MNHSQRLIAEEAAKFGAKKVSKLDTISEVVNRSIEEANEVEHVEEGVRAMSGVETMIRNSDGGASMVSSYRNIKKALEGKPAGSVMLFIRNDDGVEIDIKDSGEFNRMKGNMKRKPDAKVGSKGSWESATGDEVTVIAVKEEVESITEAQSLFVSFGAPTTKSYAIDKDKSSDQYILHRLAGSGSSKEKADHMAGRGKSTTIGKFPSVAAAKAGAKKDAGVKEEVEETDTIIEADSIPFNKDIENFLKGLPKEVVADLKKVNAGKKLEYVNVSEMEKRMKNIKAVLKKHNIQLAIGGKATWAIINRHFTKVHEAVDHIEEGVEEAYAPAGVDLKTLVGAFTIKGATKFRDSSQGRFEYRLSQDSWGKSHGLPHEVCVSSKASGAKGDWRAANVKGTVCIIATDEGPDGKPVLEKWAIARHVKYTNAESVEHQEDGVEETIQETHMKPGTVITVPHKGKMVKGKIVRWDTGGTSKARQHGGAYVVDVGEPASIIVPDHMVKVKREDVNHQEDTNVFEAISLAGMGFKKRGDASGTHRVGRLEKVSVDQLTKVFGPAHSKGSGDGKTTMEWRFVNSAGLVFTVYDYNNPPKSNSAPHNWSVGGIKDAHKISIQRAFRMMGVPGKMIKEDVDEGVEELEEAMTSTDITNKAKEIVAKAKELGVSVTCEPKVITCSKGFTKGDTNAFFKAYADCDKIRSMVPFKSRTNEWGCSTAGVGIGAQQCIKAGMVVLNKSGDGASYVLTTINAVKNTAGSLARAGIR